MRKRMRNQLLALTMNLSLLASAALPAYAAITDPFTLLGTDPCSIVDGAANFMIGIVIAVSVIFLAWGGIQYMTSGGDKMAVEQARGKITGAVVGALVGIGAYFIIRLLVTILRGTLPTCKPTI